MIMIPGEVGLWFYQFRSDDNANGKMAGLAGGLLLVPLLDRQGHTCVFLPSLSVTAAPGGPGQSVNVELRYWFPAKRFGWAC